ncbi:hypothetical protein Y475_14260 [Listeria monocytogenes]|nr:hypothetical protein [Listeria monocytogenes]
MERSLDRNRAETCSWLKTTCIYWQNRNPQLLFLSNDRSIETTKKAPILGQGWNFHPWMKQTYHSRRDRSGNVCLCPRIGEMKGKEHYKRSTKKG